MRALLARNSMQNGHIARDYIRMVEESQNPSMLHTQPRVKGAYAVLESFADHNRSLPIDPVVPIKSLVTVLNESLQGMRVADTDGGISGARLYRGLKVRLRGIPERQFIIREIYWDYEEVRLGAPGTNTEYVVPWDCLELDEE